MKVEDYQILIVATTTVFSTIIIILSGIVFYLKMKLSMRRDNLESNRHNELMAMMRENLTQRQMEVVDIAKKGFSNKEIADEMHISPNTLSKHIKEILRVTGTRSIRELLVRFHK